MIKTIKTSKISKVISSYLAIQLILTTVQPTNLFALTGGPSQPEFNAFTPIGTSDMVSLSSGNFNYNIPIMDVGGYPLNLSYDSGITMDQEASWVGLGWNLNVGQINRQVRGLPDDFNGDLMTYENNMKDNKTIGLTLSVNGQLSGTEDLGAGPSASASATLSYNNYEGFSFTPSFGVSYRFGTGTSVGMNLTPSVSDGVTVTPSASQSFDKKDKDTKKASNDGISHSIGIGTPFNSRQGLTAFNINMSASKPFKENRTEKQIAKGHDGKGADSGGVGASISFVDNTFTPSKRNAYQNNNYTFRASLGPDFWPVSAEFGASAFAMSQKLKEDEKNKSEEAYGYEFTDEATYDDILDFNRENERTISKNTRVLPTTNYTYDIYNINGQGIGGQFRPFRSQVGYVFSNTVEDSGDSFSLGAEVEAATGLHGGVDIHYSPSTSKTGVWKVPVLNKFKAVTNTNLDYEPVYFKSIGDLSVDDIGLYEGILSEENPMALDIAGGVFGKKAVSVFNVKSYQEDGSIETTSKTINEAIRRETRERRNQAILKISKAEAELDNFVNANTALSAHHTNGIKVLQPDGSTYVYGEAAVNKVKNEVSFASEGSVSHNNGTVEMNSGDDSSSNSRGVDHFYSKTVTPNYAHTFLLSSVLSSDYEDSDSEPGPSDGDLGSYTKIYYNNFVNDRANEDDENVSETSSDYNWRVPYDTNEASYNPGLYTKENDQKGSYVSGVKELKYATMIETKTHIAIFDFGKRKDGKGTNTGGSSEQLYLSKIRLYSRPEAIAAKLLNNDPGDNDFSSIDPIKTTHFEYDYSLMKNTPNGSTVDNNGKLTLKKVYFTYRGSKMGKYTPYTFNYDNANPDYQIKSYDVWGNYKPLFEDSVELLFDDNNVPVDFNVVEQNNSPSCEIDYPTTAQEYPFVDQDRTLQDLYVASWTLSSIDLPSGGRLDMHYESDDYQYVQDRAAMKMFKVVGASNSIGNFQDGIDDDELYGLDGGDKRFLIVKLLDEHDTGSYSSEEFKEDYLGEYIDKPLFFKFLLNMEKNSDCSYDYVEGYCNVDSNSTDFTVFDGPDGKYGAIPIELVDLEGGVSGDSDVNPIAKAGWYFARQNLNRYAYGQGQDNPGELDLQTIINVIGGWLPLLSEIYRGPNGYLKDRNIARRFKTDKSWIRLKHPTKSKLGGGLRVKKIEMHDNWDDMINNPQVDIVNPYSNFYGQEYDYALDNNEGSSGVATWEPNMSKENPFIEPSYNRGDRLVAPKEMNYVERPFGKSFYPSASITYSRVTVKNLARENGGDVVKRHATGKVVNEFFTTKNFPTLADNTNLEDPDNYKSNATSIIDNVLNLNIKTEFVMSQGFTIVTNDMNARNKSQKVYNENGLLISGVDYKYNVDEQTGRLNNKLPVVLENGKIAERNIGMHHDVITDFNESYNFSETYGVDTNITFFIIPAVIPIPILLGQLPFEHKKNETILRTTTTTKVVHKTGILKEKIAYDLGATVSTRNLAWDAVSGQVLLTETSNEYEDNYYNFNYPAHWAYPNMGQAVHNLGLTAYIEAVGIDDLYPDQNGNESPVMDTDYPGLEDFYPEDYSGSAWYKVSGFSGDLDQFFAVGDEVYVLNGNVPMSSRQNQSTANSDHHFWISEIEGDRMILIDKNGRIASPCGDDETREIKVVRSHRRNLQTASMASVTSMYNPIQFDQNGNIIEGIDVVEAFDYSGLSSDTINPRIINASAVTYNQYWRPQREGNIKTYPTADLNPETLMTSFPKHTTNPFVNNILGDWRAVTSHAYLTGREITAKNEQNVLVSGPRNSGFFKDFMPYYSLVNETWQPTQEATALWTPASEVTKYSPYGAELENKDALERHSSAQYGYNYTLPTAVASNSAYREIGYDGFEDYQNSSGANQHFSFKGSQYRNGNIIAVYRNDQEAHSGRYSLKVSAGETATLYKRFEELGDCIEDTNVDTLDEDLCVAPDVSEPFDCPTTIQEQLPPSGESNLFDFAPNFSGEQITDVTILDDANCSGSSPLNCLTFQVAADNKISVINNCPVSEQLPAQTYLCVQFNLSNGQTCDVQISFICPNC